MRRIQVVDSHTGGEPTRIVIAGGPDLGHGSMAERLQRFRNDFDDLRRAVVDEPRGSAVMVGGLLCEPTDTDCAAGVVFFNSRDFLQMCGHGMMGLLVTLQHLGRIRPGEHRIQTPVGDVVAWLAERGEVTIENVPCYRFAKNVEVEVPDFGRVRGDIAWGGNWFYLVRDPSLSLAFENADRLTRDALAIRKALQDNGITGADGAWIDHIEFFAEPTDVKNHSKSFVLCPGGTYDRSPCGTGTSAKIACLAADEQLLENEQWRQESFVGSVFVGSYRRIDRDRIVPKLSGHAFVSGEATLLLDPRDPFCMGIPQ